MIVGRDYLLKKPGRPSLPKHFLDTRIIPLAVNMASSVEFALERASARTGVRPAVILAGAAGVLSLALLGIGLRRSPRRGTWNPGRVRA